MACFDRALELEIGFRTKAYNDVRFGLLFCSLKPPWGRPGIDRVIGSADGVSWLIRWPRKNLIAHLTAEPQFALAA